MPRTTSLVSLSALIASVFLLTGCPPPPDLTQWQRPGSTIDDARVAMGQCGVPLPGPEPDFTANETVLYYQCMEGKGFTYKHDFHICDVHKSTPACIEKQQGHPLSQKQLDALPFLADKGFYPIKPGSGVVESQRISWRKAGASLHFSHELENDRLAISVMYECGYPEPLGSRPFEPTLMQAAKIQQCMLDRDFEPKDKLMLVCRNYPQVTSCRK
ncbi:hypothetical protein J1781_19055 [Rahnella sp. C60]|jgi:hypothetical protein|uniref:Lipoprotein n=2 Tax=Rahnella perminowiae TaxID=2816244 RepID=A0ABS6L3J8_9GAMM|nr:MULTISPECIES: hypothetical protein [Rahnella]MBU9816925.1 hypothetical protein [Rahnella perminowiae]MBU9824518.1 hypothetical protein [Rahnella perminowiae]MBU9836421.1 hypothetical protein [Rahnella perminowiae]MCX2943293.1 hypothetical protein [Rahnella perminowiae]